MSIIDTLRPTATAESGSYTAQPTGTLHAVTADDSDSTYALSPASTGSVMRLVMGTHTPAADHERHAARARVRFRADGATDSRLAWSPHIGTGAALSTGATTNGTTPNTYSGSFAISAGLAGTNPLEMRWSCQTQASPGGRARVLEAYVEVDTRHKPVVTPEILDGGGVDQSGGTVTDTNIVRSSFAAVDFDGLTGRSWRVAIYTLAQTLEVGFVPFDTLPFSSAEGNGAPSGTADHVLPNDDYVAYFQAFSNIRLGDPFGSDLVSVAFTVDASPALAPANMTVTPVDDPPAYEICWEAPADSSLWTEPENVYVEITRTDCNGTSRIALLPNAIASCYTDRFAPLASMGEFCGADDHECEVCYEVRYWGYRGISIEPIETVIPEGVILAWPDTEASIPSNWSRVAALNGRYPKGIPTAGTNPGATGGQSNHSHTGPTHAHSTNHSHSMPNSGVATGVPKMWRNTNAPLTTIAHADHAHKRPGAASASVNSATGSQSSGTSTHEAPRKEVIFVASDGVDTTVPAGMLGIRHASSAPSGWVLEDSDGAGDSSRPPYWKGAAANGSKSSISPGTHAHSLPNHTHSGSSHGHSQSPVDGGPTLNSSTRHFATASMKAAGQGHGHFFNINSAAAASLASGGSGTSGPGAGTISTDPPFRTTSFIESIAGPQFTGLIGMWLGTIANIPLGWVLCDGNNGTPDFFGRYPRHKGALSVNLTGGGASHAHSRPSHGHSTSSHSHSTTFAGGASPSSSLVFNVVPVATSQSVLDERSGLHGHSSPNSGSTTPSVGGGGNSNTNPSSTEPLHTEVAFIMLAEANTEPTDLQLLVASEPAIFCVDAIPNPDPSGCDWIRGYLDGDICVCPSRTFTSTRPFAAFQPLGGGIPTVTSGRPGGRDYTLVWAVSSETDLKTCEAILAQTLIHYTPAGQRPLFMAPNPLSVEKIKIKDYHRITASFLEVVSPPIPDPALVVPEPAA